MKQNRTERKNKLLKALIIILAVVIILFFAAAIWMASFVMTGKRQTLAEAMAWQSAHYDTSFYEDLEKTDYTVTGFGGYILHARLLRNPVPTDKYVILSHGITDNRFGSLKYVPTYLALGYNCVIYDLRGHGENEKAPATYGILEGQDLKALVDDTRSRYPELTQLGLHGESLGAATTVTSLKYKPEVDFAVADCGFSDLANVLQNGGKLPSFVLSIADLGMKLRFHVSLRDMKPIDALDGNRIPILFIHGTDDPLILPKNSQDMYERTQGMKEIRLISGAKHADSVLTDPEEYLEAVSSFLDRINRE